MTEAWSSLLAVEQVVTDVGERFGGEEPIHPDARALLDEVKATVLALTDDLKPDLDVVLPLEPSEEVTAWLRSLITEEDRS